MVKILRLLGVHLFAALAIWLSTYVVGLDIFLSWLYLIIITGEVKSLREEKVEVKWLGALLWLMPPLLLSFMTVFHLNNLTIFLLSFWYTPLLPLLSIKPYLFANGVPLYYYFLVTLPILFSMHFYLLMVSLKHTSK